jgi:hypothetical protein
MSVTLLTVLVLLVGLVTYMLLKRLVTPVRVIAACVLMVLAAAIILQTRPTIARLWDSSGDWGFPILSDKRTLNAPSPSDDPGRAASLLFQSICKEDHLFLDEILENQIAQQQGKPARIQGQNFGRAGIIGSGDEPVQKTELAVNSVELKRSESVAHKETVKRAQLVIHNETFKRAELARSRQQ